MKDLIALGVVALAATTQAGAVDVFDFGDAPATYAVTLEHNGARHLGVGPFLGTGRNVEADGTPHDNALLSTEGDDGVTGPAQWPQGTVVTLTITVSGDCRLDAWVDWAGNGSWAGLTLDAKDRIASTVNLHAGANTLDVYVPEAAVPGVTFARFRVSSDGCLGSTGPAMDGEVEDYPLLIARAVTGDQRTPTTVATLPDGKIQLHWTGDRHWCWQLEFSDDMIDWHGHYVPAGEKDGAMVVTVPTQTADPVTPAQTRFYRLRRAPLVTDPVECRPGGQIDLSFVQTDGSLTQDDATGQWGRSSLTRNYRLYVPDAWNRDRKWPLIMMIHGHSMSGEVFALTQAELRSIANERGYITVFVDATEQENETTWFAYPDPSTVDPAKIQPYLDDKAFILSLTDHLVKNTGLEVDSERLYVAGFSNGGSLTHFISSDGNHPFRAFAIMESGTAWISRYEPRVQFDFGAAPLLPAKPRPCIVMNMITSPDTWSFLGQPVLDSEGNPVDFDHDGTPDRTPTARHNMERWLVGNGLTAPPGLSRHGYLNTTGADGKFPHYENHFTRPDAWWPAEQKQQYAGAYAELPEPEIPDSLREPAMELPPAWFLNQANVEAVSSYPHLSFTQARETYVVAGTWSEEVWATPPGQTDREVRFHVLSEGGHAFPNGQDGTGWNAQLGVMDFFAAH